MGNRNRLVTLNLVLVWMTDRAYKVRFPGDDDDTAVWIPRDWCEPDDLDRDEIGEPIQLEMTEDKAEEKGLL